MQTQKPSLAYEASRRVVEDGAVAPDDELVLKAFDLVDLVRLVEGVDLDASDVDQLVVGVSEVDADDGGVGLNSIGPGDGSLVLEADELVGPVNDVVGGGDDVKLGDLVEVEGALDGSSAGNVGVLNEFTSIEDGNLESSIEQRIDDCIVTSLES